MKRFEEEVPYLDFAEVQTGLDCECFFDIGFTVTPPNNPPLVGLLKLDRLEASFGAGGYNMGKAHCLGTLDGYGAIQAEMQLEHARQSHITHSSSYSTWWQKFRPDDNELSWFALADVANNTNKFKLDAQHIQTVLREESEHPITHGVRREFRGSFEALLLLKDEDLDILVNPRLSSDTRYSILNLVCHSVLNRFSTK